ncbi:branched-chain amino acid ABC transporter permease [Microbacterium sp. KRD172]|uniref:branched-chain amino acid ABC transporter permease n=1 Tax=Microbacterium sp. KRD172 TaxID=2729727 RepID=UPI0019CF8D1B|nr:branched-chain amino acid ABC transporter permease [Microbacterium sp. KRD172]
MITALLNGLAFGMLMLVLSSGLALIFGLRNVVNFAHGALYMVGAYIGFAIGSVTNFWVALVVTPIILGAVGVLLDRFGLRYLAKREVLDLVLLTFGLTFVLTGLVQSVWGTQPKSINAPPGLDGSIPLPEASYPTYRIFLIVTGVLLGVALILWLRFSKTGLYVRASTMDRTVATVVGVDVDRVSATVVGLGFAFAGAAGVLAGPYLSLSPNMGVEILVLTFIVVVVGGLGSLGGAMVAAVVLGLIVNLSAVFVPWFAAYAPYALMLVVLLFRPRGFAGTRTLV